MTFLRNISPENQSDIELIEAYQHSKDAQFLSVLYQRYMDLVLGVCLKYFKDVERSKDAVMDIYLELTAKLLQHEVSYFKGWLHVLVRNHCLMQLRSPKQLKTAELNQDLMQSEDNSHLKNELLEKEAHFNLLAHCMEQLQEEQKNSIELFFLQHKCYQEISEITGYEWNKVRSYIQNGKRNLKICMDEQNIRPKS